MRVCHVWERFWPLEIGGVERYIISLTNYLHKTRKIDFSVITGRTKVLLLARNIKKFEAAPSLEVHRLGPNPVDILNGAVMYLNGESLPKIQKMKFTGLCYESCRTKVAQSADVFHVHGIWGDLEYVNLGVYLTQHFKKPLVVTLHGGFVGDALQGGMPLKSAAVKNILFNYADAITTYSQEVLGSLKEMGLAKKSHLITNFVDAEQFKNKNSRASPDETAIYVGRLEPLQTPELLVQAFKTVNQRFPTAKLQIVGYGRLYEYMKQLIHELNLDETVSLLGKQSDVRRFLWSSDIFIATNFGYIASLEAWSAGLAVVAPQFGILKETVKHEDNGLLFKPNDADDLAKALIKLLEDKDLRAKLAANGLENVKNYDIGAVAPKMAQVYESVAANA